MEALNQKAKKPGPHSAAFLNECKGLLLEKKDSLLNHAHQLFSDYQSRDRGNDEGDQSVENLAENQYVTSQQRTRAQLLEVESALARIESGHYGVCEETEEFIEEDRLRALPWTRLSIEGAEIREALKKRFAR